MRVVIQLNSFEGHLLIWLDKSVTFQNIVFCQIVKSKFCKFEKFLHKNQFKWECQIFLFHCFCFKYLNYSNYPGHLWASHWFHITFLGHSCRSNFYLSASHMGGLALWGRQEKNKDLRLFQCRQKTLWEQEIPSLQRPEAVWKPIWKFGDLPRTMWRGKTIDRWGFREIRQWTLVH